MSEDRLLRARALVQKYEHSRAAVVELAELASLAARIEPELLRALRLRLAPHLNVGVEGDLWFSQLVQARGADGITFSTEVAEVLQGRLRQDPERLARAWEVIEECHRKISPALGLEEKVTHLALSGANQTDIDNALGPALVALGKEGRTGLSAWAARALPRLPKEARSTRAAWILSFAASRHLERPISIEGAVPSDLMEIDFSSVFADLRETEIGVRLVGNDLEIGDVRGIGASRISVADTSPRLVEVRWQGDASEQREIVYVAPDALVRLRVGVGTVRLCTLTGAIYELRPPAARGEGSFGGRVASLEDATMKLVREEIEEPLFVGEWVRIESGKPIERELNGGQGHRYELALEAGQFAHLVVEQKGIDVAVVLRRPDGSGSKVDSPNWRLGREVLYTIAEEAGVYRVEVISEEPAVSSGRYEIRLDEQHAAMERDRARLEAWRVFRRGEGLRTAGNLSEALAAYWESLPLWRALEDPEWTAETQYRIGWTLQDLGSHAEALEALREAQLELRGPRWPVEEASLLNRIAMSLLRQGMAAEALRCHQEALERSREIEFPAFIVSALNGMGNVHLFLGEVHAALDSFRESLVLARSEGLSREESLALLGQGMALLFLNKPEQALEELQQALTIQEQIDHFPADRTEILRQMADALQRLGRLDEARQYLDQALAWDHEHGDAVEEVSNLISLGAVHLNSGRLEEARQTYERALEVSRATQNQRSEAFSLLGLGRCDYQAGNAGQALAVYQTAEKIFQAIGHRRGELLSSLNMARALHFLGREHEALTRLATISPNIEEKRQYYDLHIDVLMRLHEQQPNSGYDNAALEIHERKRAAGLMRLLTTEVKMQIGRGVDPSLLAREKALVEQINRQQREQKDFEEDLLRELETVRADIRKKSPRYASLTQPRSLRFLEMQALLPGDDTLLLVYSLGEEYSYLWCVGRNGRASRRLPARSWIEDMVARVVAEWRRPGQQSSAERWARRLSEGLLGPVAHQLGSRRLVIVGDGALQSLPFGALPDPVSPREPLLVRHEIVYLLSVSLLAVLRQEFYDRWPARGELAIVADPVVSPNDPRLSEAEGGESMPRSILIGEGLGGALRDVGVEGLERLSYADEQAKRIGRHFRADRSKILLGFEASRDQILSGELKNYRRLHFATYGVLNSKSPELSGLVMSLWDPQGKPRYGFLPAHEIYNLKLPAELVVLSACRGVGQEFSGEGLISLTRSFMYAGAPRIVVSLWQVNDLAAVELMDRFYRAMIEYRLAPAQALRAAQLSMLRGKYSAPFLWAGFIFQGEWSREIPEAPDERIGVSLDDAIEASVVALGGGVPDDDLPPPDESHTPPNIPYLGD